MLRVRGARSNQEPLLGSSSAAATAGTGDDSVALGASFTGSAGASGGALGAAGSLAAGGAGSLGAGALGSSAGWARAGRVPAAQASASAKGARYFAAPAF